MKKDSTLYKFLGCLDLVFGFAATVAAVLTVAAVEALVVWVPVGAVADGGWVKLGSTWDLTSELLEGLALGLWDEKGGEDTAQHEESEDLDDVIEPWVLSSSSGARGGTASTERTNDGLGDDRANLAGSGGETVGGGTVTGWEALSRNDESGSVGACDRMLVNASRTDM